MSALPEPAMHGSRTDETVIAASALDAPVIDSSEAKPVADASDAAAPLAQEPPDARPAETLPPADAATGDHPPVADAPVASGATTHAYPHPAKESLLPPALTLWIAARTAARRLAGAPSWPGFEAALTTARSAGAALLVDAADLLTVAAALRDRVAPVLPNEPQWKPLARLLEAQGAAPVAFNPGAPTPAIATDVVLVIPLAAGPRAIVQAADVVAAFAMPIVPLAVRATGRVWTIESGLPVPLSVPPTATAAFGAPLPPPQGEAGRAYLVEVLARAFDQVAEAPTRALPHRRRLSRPPALRLYALGMSLLRPIAPLYLLDRLRRGKEMRRRLRERRGRAGLARPDGRLVWFHAASVGESLSILPLVQAIHDRRLCDTLLMTTGTVSSAQLMGQRLPAGILHQFVPLDVPAYARRFLDHWRPAAAIFVESELWPNLMHETVRRGHPLAIVNGRLSLRSYERWLRWPRTARAILTAPRLIVAQTPEHARRFAAIGAANVVHVGNLKFDCPAPPVDAAELLALKRATALRTVWLAASTHDGEEGAIAEAHVILRDRYPNLLTIVVPRHPERGATVVKEMEARWLVAARRSAGQPIAPKTDVYVADTLGELGLFYRLARIAFVGGSLVSTGGHNPIEPALLDCAILHGPHIHNFRDMYDAIDAVGGAIPVSGAAELARHLAALLADPDKVGAMAATNRVEIGRNRGSLERALTALRPLFAP